MVKLDCQASTGSGTALRAVNKLDAIVAWHLVESVVCIIHPFACHYRARLLASMACIELCSIPTIERQHILAFEMKRNMPKT